MITVHHLNKSRSQRVLWMLEELEQPYELVKYERDPKTMYAPPELEKVHPLGKSPVVVDGDATLAESGAILEYLVETYGKGRFAPAPGTAAHRDYRYFLHYAEGSLAPFLLLRLVFTKIKTTAPFVVRPIARAIASKVAGSYVDPNLARHVKFVGDHLERHPWFAGDEFSAADVQMSVSVESMAARCKDLGVSPKVQDWLDRIHARPAYQRAIERGGPGMSD